MSEVLKTQESVPANPPVETTPAAVEVDKSIPEPAVVEPASPEQPPAASTSAPTTTEAIASTEEPAVEKAKEAEKSDDLARTLIKGFQSKIAGVFPKKSEKGEKAEKGSESKEETKEDSTESKEEKKEEVKEVKDVKEGKERRSASRKRNSLFGGLGLGKKEEKTSAEETAAPEVAKEIAPEPTQAAEPNAEQPAAEAPVSTETPPERPVPSKRLSIFDTLKNQFVRKEKVESPTAASKEAETPTTTAPVIPEVGSSETPAKEDVVPDVIADKVQEIQNNLEAKAEKLATKAEKRKSSLPFGLGLARKEKPTSNDEEATEKPLSPFARIRATVKSKTSPKSTHEKKEELSVPAEPKIEEAPAQPIVSEPEPAVANASPTVAASA